ENIWQTYDFFPESVAGFNFLNDGRSFTRLEKNQIVQYDLETGQRSAVILRGDALPKENGWTGDIDSYEFSADETKILLSTDSRSIYRHSSEAFFFVYDREAESLTPVYPKKRHRLASLNISGDKVAFVVDNNLHFKDLTTGRVKRITNDGKINEVINGGTDWVYEEEFSFDRGFEWSPDGLRIAFYRFDETSVPEFTYTDFHDNLYPEYNTFKYPKVGEANSRVSVHVYDVQFDSVRELMVVNNKPDDKWHYIPRIKWTQDPTQLCMTRMNRHQNELELVIANTTTGKQSTILTEKNPYYIDITNHLTFLKNGKQFIWSSEKNGWRHIYLHSMNGKELGQVTGGNWDVTNFYGVDEENGRIYFQAAKRDPLQREVYTKSIQGKDLPRPLAEAPGTNSANFSSTFDYFVLTHSTINQPATYQVMDGDGQLVRKIIDNGVLAKKQETYGVRPV
ncbi:MAG: DPP IV N-terminal domain-containing protein, partial [Bacteroidota bacterium]